MNIVFVFEALFWVLSLDGERSWGMKLFIAGHKGMVGSALVRRLQGQKGVELVLRDRNQLDLLNQNQVFDFFQKEKPMMESTIFMHIIFEFC